MKIKSVRLEKFRQFADTTIDASTFNVLVGPNNSGKTTILHAIRSFFFLMHGHVRIDGDPPTIGYHKRFISDATEIAPTPEIRELWHKQEAGKPLKITITFEDDVSFCLVLRQQFGQIHVSAENLPAGVTAKRLGKYLGGSVAFIPGLVGVLVAEPYATRARRNALAAQGRYSEIFRSSLAQLNDKAPKAIERINEALTDLFDVTVSNISFDQDSEEYVTVQYKRGGVEYDIASSGSGFQQVLQVLTYLFLSEPKVLLIDEPDAHLHSKLQGKLGKLFQRVATDLDAQVFLSTHSIDLIDTFETTDVIVVDATKKHISPIGKDADIVAALVDANVVEVSALSRLLSSRRLVVVEDKDLTILKAIDKSIGGPLFSSTSNSYVLSAKGVSNFRAVAELGKVLKGISGTEFQVSFLQDRDGMPAFIVKEFLASQSHDGVEPVLLSRHEIESYLLEPALFESAALLVKRKVSASQAEAAILQGADRLKAKARRQALNTAQGVNRHLSAKWKDADLEEKVYEWFDGLDVKDLATVRRVFPGKELLQEALAVLNTGVKVQITRGHLVAAISKKVLSPTITKIVSELAN